jgi:hypothetical protein
MASASLLVPLTRRSRAVSRWNNSSTIGFLFCYLTVRRVSASWPQVWPLDGVESLDHLQRLGGHW